MRRCTTLTRWLAASIYKVALFSVPLTGCAGAAAMPNAPSEAAAYDVPAGPAQATQMSTGEQSMDAGSMDASPAVASPMGHSAKTAVEGGPSNDKVKAEGPAGQPLMVIYEGQLGLEVRGDQISDSLEKIGDLAEAGGGHLLTRTDTTVAIRVPSATFRLTMAKLSKLGDVTHRAVSAEDVGEEFHDLDVRLANLRATRQRIEQFLAAAKTMDEMLRVEKELERIAAQIDQIEGRLRFLRTRSAFSLITVTLSPRPVAPTEVAKPVVVPSGVELPVDWMNNLGLGKLMDLKS